MRIDFNIRDNETTNEKVLAFAKANGYEDLIRQGEELIQNPEPPKAYAERVLKRIFLEPWVVERAQDKFRAEYNSLMGD